MHRRSLTSAIRPELTTTVRRSLPSQTKHNWFGKLCRFLGPSCLVVGLVGGLWVPMIVGVPTYVAGSAVCLLLLGVANLNSWTEIKHG